jgi:transcriptional regulator GlxA family with amidase domain
VSPEKWLIEKRLTVAHDKIRSDGKKVSDVCLEVGFKNLSHFSRGFQAEIRLYTNEIAGKNNKNVLHSKK